MINQRIIKDYFNGNDYVIVRYHFENGRLLCNVEKDVGTYLDRLYRAYYYLVILSFNNECRYSINSMAYLKYLNQRLKYDHNKRDAEQELKGNVIGEDVINVIKEFRNGDL